MQVRIKKLIDCAQMPYRGSDAAAGWDLKAISDATIRPGETKKVGTGLSIEIPDGYFGDIYARSGLATKMGLRPANCTGIIDSDYRGEIMVALYNDSDIDRNVNAGDRTAHHSEV